MTIDKDDPRNHLTAYAVQCGYTAMCIYRDLMEVEPGLLPRLPTSPFMHREVIMKFVDIGLSVQESMVRPKTLGRAMDRFANWLVDDQAEFSVSMPVVRNAAAIFAVTYAGIHRAGIESFQYPLNRSSRSIIFALSGMTSAFRTSTHITNVMFVEFAELIADLNQRVHDYPNPVVGELFGAWENAPESWRGYGEFSLFRDLILLILPRAVITSEKMGIVDYQVRKLSGFAGSKDGRS